MEENLKYTTDCGLCLNCSECVDKDICPYYLERLDDEM